VLRFLRRFGPFSPVTPFSPPSDTATGYFNGRHPKSNFVAPPKSKFLSVNIAMSTLAIP
jgi:hypothetical protein